MSKDCASIALIHHLYILDGRYIFADAILRRKDGSVISDLILFLAGAHVHRIPSSMLIIRTCHLCGFQRDELGWNIAMYGYICKAFLI